MAGGLEFESRLFLTDFSWKKTNIFVVVAVVVVDDENFVELIPLIVDLQNRKMPATRTNQKCLSLLMSPAVVTEVSAHP